MRIPAAAGMVLAMALLSPHGAASQQCPAPEPGTPIRFIHIREVGWLDAEGNAVRRETVETAYRDASLVAVDGDTLRAQMASGTLAVPLSEVADLRVRCPTSAGRSALRGFTTGFFLGGGAGLVLGLIAASGEDSYFADAQVEVALLGAGVVGLAGGLVGALIGAAGGPGTAWTAVPLVSPPTPETGGEWTVGMRIPLGG